MANLIQIKRSTTNTSPAALTAGELAYSYANSSNSLFVGNTSVGGPIRIAGGNYVFLHQANTAAPGALTANAAVIVNGNSFITNWKTNSLTVGVDGETVAISNISTFANSTQLGLSANGANTELVTSWAVKTYIDGNAPRLPNTYVAFGANSVANGGSSGFTFDSTNLILSIGNTTVNTQISQTAITTTATIAAGNTTITGFVNTSSYGTFGGAVNAASLNVSGAAATGNLSVTGTIGSGNTTVTGFVNVSTYGTFGGAVNAASLNVSGLVTTGNTTTTGFINVSSYGTYGGAVNATSFNSTGTATSTFANNVTVTGTANVLSLNVSGDANISGNLYITGNLVSFNVSTLSINDPLLFLASNNFVADILDIGFVGAYGPDANAANHRHTGLFRDATDGVWKLFSGLAVEPTTTVDTSNATYTIATLQSYLSAGGATATGLIANATTIAITANSTLNVAIVANTLTLSTALGGISGGTGLASFTTEDLLVANSSNGFRKLNVGSEGYILQVASGVVAWNTLDGGSF